MTAYTDVWKDVYIANCVSIPVDTGALCSCSWKAGYRTRSSALPTSYRHIILVRLVPMVENVAIPAHRITTMIANLVWRRHEANAYSS
jgi:hypothetical protein